jgi:diguanylate cyclase (GGDEF)-like protein
VWNIQQLPVEPSAATGGAAAQVGATATDPTRVSAREMSGVATRLLVGYLRARAGEAAVAAALERAGERRTAAELEDDRGWSSYARWLALLEAAATVLDDPGAARRIGASVVDQRVGGASRVLVRALGSAEAVYRQATRVSAKFSTVKTVAPLQVGRQRASIAGPASVFELAWSTRRPHGRRGRRRRQAALEADNALLTAQLDAFQLTVAELVAPSDLGSLLDNLAARSAAAVHAQRVLLAIRPQEQTGPVVYADGFGAEEAAGVAADLLAARLAEDPNRMVVEVASSRRRYGRILAENPRGLAFLAGERRLLEAHARLAAAALDSAAALEEAHRRGVVAAELLKLAGSLAEAGSEEAVALRLCAATPGVAGADAAAVFRWDESTHTMSGAAATGFPPPVAEQLRAMQVRRSDSPEVERFFLEPGLRTYELDSADQFVRETMAGLGAARVTVAPLVADERLLGAVVAAWMGGRPLPPLDPDLPARLHGLADQAATALQRARLTDRVHHQALHDALTGLPNQTLFMDRLGQAIASARREHRHLAVAFLDLNRFKQVNDTLGHPVGDALLQQVAGRLAATVRSSDTVARLGGDEFTILFADLERTELALDAGARVRAAFQTPFQLNGRTLFAAPSIGLAVFPADGDRPDALLSNADAAMYQAKRRNSLAVHRYTPELHTEAEDQLSLETDLHEAVDGHQLRVLYQPQVELATGRVVGAEALVRWSHPTRGLVSPGDFIPLAERTGQIVAVDLDVLAQACCQRRRWTDAGMPLTVAVNLSGRTLEEPEAVADIAAILDDTGTPPGGIELELTESTSMQHDTDLPALLAQLKGLGLRLAIDDFGTGYSMLSWLHQLPVDRLKIDRSFVGRLGAGADSAVVAAILAMARSLELEVIAEGVETPAQAELLRAHGCTLAQGYLFSPPVEPAAFVRLLGPTAALHGATRAR